MNFLDKLIGGVGNFERQHIYKPAVKAWQTINPGSGYNRLKPVVRTAEKQYGFTPSFRAIVNSGNPSLTKGFSDTSALKSGIQSSAEYIPNNPVNSIQLNQNTGFNLDTLLHEALHREWALKPNDRNKFVAAYTKSAPPILKNYLASRLAGYKDFSGRASLNDFGTLSPSIQNEVHSYIPEFYHTNPNIALDGPLANYYSQFYNVASQNPTGIDRGQRPVPQPPILQKLISARRKEGF